jgi:cellulose synthase (UDP-forming)
MRLHYLISLPVVNLSVLILLMYPFERELRMAWLPLTAVPYYALYGWDLVLAGYRWVDLFRVYALNLLLIPVNLAGVGQSLAQFCTGKKSPFARTPKIAGKTLAPTSIVAAEVALLVYCLLGTVVDSLNDRWLHATFAFCNTSIFAYALDRFVGVKDVLWQLVAMISTLRQLVRERLSWALQRPEIEK